MKKGVPNTQERARSGAAEPWGWGGGPAFSFPRKDGRHASPSLRRSLAPAAWLSITSDCSMNPSPLPSGWGGGLGVGGGRATMLTRVFALNNLLCSESLPLQTPGREQEEDSCSYLYCLF